MALISRLGVVLGLDAGEFNAGLGKAEAGLGKFSAGAGAAKLGIAAAAAAMVAASKSAIDFADSINDVAKANEVSVGTVLEFSQALSVSGGKAENVSKIFSTLTNKIDEAATGSQETRDKFAKLGVSLKDIEMLDEKQLLDKTIKGLAQIPDTITRNALAMDLLGKGIKNVDIIGLEKEFQKINGTMEGSDEKFGKIGDALDRLDRLSQKMKTDLANNIAEPVSNTTIILEKLYDTLSKGNSILDEQGKKLEKYGISFKDVFLGGAMTTMRMGQMFYKVKSAQGGASDGTDHYTPMSQWYQDNQVKPSILQSSGPKRAIEETKEQIAAREKIKKQIDSETEALIQQTRTLKLQTSEIGEQKSEYQKMLLEFEKGGKYEHVRNQTAKEALLTAAKEKDEKVALTEQYKIIYDLDVARTMQLHAELEAAQQLAATELIRKQQHDDQLRFMVDDTNRATERLDLERAMAGQSDTQVRKALEYFDVESKILQMKRQDGLLTQEQIDAYREAENARILANESNTRAQNTFQAGWSKAYENFTERAKDSASLGAEAFNSMTGHMSSALDQFVSTGKLSFSGLAQSIIQDLIKIQLKAQASSLFGSLFGGGGGMLGNFGLFSSSTNFNNGAGLFGGLFADGGEPPMGKASIVGERGPELFIPKTSGTIIPNNALGAMGNQPQVVYNGPYIANLSAIDTQSATQFLAKNKTAVWSANQSAQRSLPQSR